MNIGTYIINSKDKKMLNAELVTQKKFSTSQIKKKKKKSLFTGFIIIFKGQLRETERGNKRAQGLKSREGRRE